VLNIARDFSCCIVTADADLLVANEGLPIHVLSGPDMMARVMKEYSPGLARGDAYLNNSPYHGCSHAADHTLLVPVLDNTGRHRFTVLAKAHQADIGNSIPTTYHGSAVDVYQEGALIFPSVQVQKDFETNADFVRMCRMRIRVPDQWWGDFLAMLGAVRIGEQEITAMAADVGWDRLTEFSTEWLDYSERRMTDAIRDLPAGSVRRSSTHDPFPGTPASGIPVNVTVTIDPVAARIAVDLTDNIDCLPCGGRVQFHRRNCTQKRR
jgi:N-methylhydantoinase B